MRQSMNNQSLMTTIKMEENGKSFTFLQMRLFEKKMRGIYFWDARANLESGSKIALTKETVYV